MEYVCLLEIIKSNLYIFIAVAEYEHKRKSLTPSFKINDGSPFWIQLRSIFHQGTVLKVNLK